MKKHIWRTLERLFADKNGTLWSDGGTISKSCYCDSHFYGKGYETKVWRAILRVHKNKKRSFLWWIWNRISSIKTDKRRDDSRVNGNNGVAFLFIWAKELSEKYKYKPLDPIQLADIAKNKEECVRFFHTYERYFIAIKQVVLKILKKLGSATVSDIVEQIKYSNHPAVKMKVALKFPNIPSRLDVLVACVLKENKIPHKKIGKKIVYSLKWSPNISFRRIN